MEKNGGKSWRIEKNREKMNPNLTSWVYDWLWFEIFKCNWAIFRNLLVWFRFMWINVSRLSKTMAAPAETFKQNKTAQSKLEWLLSQPNRPVLQTQNRQQQNNEKPFFYFALPNRGWLTHLHFHYKKSNSWQKLTWSNKYLISLPCTCRFTAFSGTAFRT